MDIGSPKPWTKIPNSAIEMQNMRIGGTDELADSKEVSIYSCSIPFRFHCGSVVRGLGLIIPVNNKTPFMCLPELRMSINLSSKFGLPHSEFLRNRRLSSSFPICMTGGMH